MDNKSAAAPPTPNVSLAPPTPNVPLAPPLPSTSVLPTLPPPNSNDFSFTSIPPTITNYDQTEYNETPGLLRAGLTTKPRLILMTSIGSFWGFSMGAFLGGRQSGLQYLAENAHKLPTTVQGWYFYHKTKNYRMMLGGVKKGIRFAGKTGGLCLVYGALESALDDASGEPHLMNSVTAGIGAATVFSALSKLTRGSFRYSIFFGAMFGLTAGGLNDLHRYASGDTPTYVRWLASLTKKEEAKKVVEEK